MRGRHAWTLGVTALASGMLICCVDASDGVARSGDPSGEVSTGDGQHRSSDGGKSATGSDDDTGDPASGNAPDDAVDAGCADRACLDENSTDSRRDSGVMDVSGTDGPVTVTVDADSDSGATALPGLFEMDGSVDPFDQNHLDGSCSFRSCTDCVLECWEDYDPELDGQMWCGHLVADTSLFTWSGGPCPRDDLIAACANAEDLRANYYYSGVAIETVRQSCEAMAGWWYEP